MAFIKSEMHTTFHTFFTSTCICEMYSLLQFLQFCCDKCIHIFILLEKNSHINKKMQNGSELSQIFRINNANGTEMRQCG